MKYAFIHAHRPFFRIRSMCRVFKVHPSGFYSWLKQPLSNRDKQDRRQTVMLKEAWEDSGKVYGYRKLHSDLRDLGEVIGLNRAERLTRLAGIKAQIGYKRRPGHYGGKPAIVADNQLDRQFNPDGPDKAWVTDITYIRTHEGWGYLCVVVDLFSRRVVGWSFGARMTTDLALQALLAAVWRRKPKERVMVHSPSRDIAAQYPAGQWIRAHSSQAMNGAGSLITTIWKHP